MPRTPFVPKRRATGRPKRGWLKKVPQEDTGGGKANVLAAAGVDGAVAVPSRIFVGITMFGLIAALVVVPFTLVVVTCAPGAAQPLLGLFAGSDCTVFGPGQKIFLGVASLLTVVFTVMSWRALLAGARQEAVRRARQAGQGRRPDDETEGPSGPS